MNHAELVRRTAFLLPGFLAFTAALAPAPGYDVSKYFAVATCLALLVASHFTQSDGLHTASMVGSTVLLGFEATQFWLPLSFAVVVSLLVAFDLYSLTKSLLGLTYRRVDLQERGATSAYLRILGRQAMRSSSIGFVTFLISLAILGTPVPLLIFSNPVSGSGLFALSTLFLILLVISGVRLPRRTSRVT